MKDVLIVGSGGTLGGAAVRYFGCAGVDFVGRSDPAPETLDLLSRADTVINLGGPRVRPGLSRDDYLATHLGVVRTTVAAMRPSAHLIHVSSTAVFGSRGACLSPQSLESPERFPNSGYAWAKLSAEHAARALAKERGLRVTILRPSMVYGDGFDSALSTLKRLSKKGVTLGLHPKNIRQHLTYGPLLFAALEAAARGLHPDGRVYLVADPFVLTNSDLSPARGRTSLTLRVPLRPIAKIHEVLLRSGVPSPLALEALAVLCLDNEFDCETMWSELSLNRADFARDQSFEPYWENAR